MNRLSDPVFACAAVIALWLLGMLAPAWAEEPAALDDAVLLEVRSLAQEASSAAAASQPGTRVDIAVGRLDPRLRLAPCAQVQPYLPPHVKLWGPARIGLRCASGPVRWNVYLPITVHVYARALVAAGPLASGSVLSAADLREAEVDLAAEPGIALARADQAVGRTLARPIAPGAALRSSHLKARQWFAAGDTVRIVAVGTGYAVSGEGQALSPGIEGQAVRVRTDAGRVVTGQAVGERRVELAL